MNVHSLNQIKIKARRVECWLNFTAINNYILVLDPIFIQIVFSVVGLQPFLFLFHPFVLIFIVVLFFILVSHFVTASMVRRLGKNAVAYSVTDILILGRHP